jgi:hypothetical protein
MAKKVSIVIYIVLATVPNWQFGSDAGLESNWNCCNGSYNPEQQNRTQPTAFWLNPHFRELRTLAPIQYLSCDDIAIWYVCKRCSFRCSFCCNSPIWDPMTSHWVALKHAQFPPLFDSNSTNSDRIANWNMRGVRASSTASFNDILYGNMITTQILHWSQSCEFAKMRLCWIMNTAKIPQLYVWCR